MIRLKKILASVVIVALLATSVLVSCGKTTSVTSEEKEEQTSADSTEHPSDSTEHPEGEHPTDSTKNQ